MKLLKEIESKYNTLKKDYAEFIKSKLDEIVLKIDNLDLDNLKTEDLLFLNEFEDYNVIYKECPNILYETPGDLCCEIYDIKDFIEFKLNNIMDVKFWNGDCRDDNLREFLWGNISYIKHVFLECQIYDNEEY